MLHVLENFIAKQQAKRQEVLGAGIMERSSFEELFNSYLIIKELPYN